MSIALCMSGLKTLFDAVKFAESPVFRSLENGTFGVLDSNEGHDNSQLVRKFWYTKISRTITEIL